jgi:hypothetical protein
LAEPTIAFFIHHESPTHLHAYLSSPSSPSLPSTTLHLSINEPFHL